MQKKIQNLVQHRFFESFIIGLIILNGIVLGIETSASIMQAYEKWLLLINNIIIGVFVLEAILKIVAVMPRFRLYFGDWWNLFDFFVVVISLIPSAGQWSMLARLARLLRVMRLISALPQLRLIVSTLVRSIPGMFNVIILMSVLFYVYAVAGFYLFHEHDPLHWENLGISLLTLFRIVTLEDWTDVMYTAMEMHSMSWIYFVSFVIFGTFVVVNLFIAVVLNNLEDAKHEKLESIIQPPSKDEIMKELMKTQQALQRLQLKLDQSDH